MYSMDDILAFERGSTRIDEAKQRIKKIMNGVVSMMEDQSKGKFSFFIPNTRSVVVELTLTRNSNDESWSWKIDLAPDDRKGCSYHIWWNSEMRRLESSQFWEKEWKDVNFATQQGWLLFEILLPDIVTLLAQEFHAVREKFTFFQNLGRQQTPVN